jgi:hypothetical protein
MWKSVYQLILQANHVVIEFFKFLDDITINKRLVMKYRNKELGQQQLKHLNDNNHT